MQKKIGFTSKETRHLWLSAMSVMLLGYCAASFEWGLLCDILVALSTGIFMAMNLTMLRVTVLLYLRSRKSKKFIKEMMVKHEQSIREMIERYQS